MLEDRRKRCLNEFAIDALVHLSNNQVISWRRFTYNLVYANCCTYRVQIKREEEIFDIDERGGRHLSGRMGM